MVRQYDELNGTEAIQGNAAQITGNTGTAARRQEVHAREELKML